MYTILSQKDRLNQFELLDPDQVASAVVESFVGGSVPSDVYDYAQFAELKPVFYHKIK
jgi:hypothetical protein